MRPSPIPDEEVWPDTTRHVIAPPGGNFLHPDISAVEALIERSPSGMHRYSVRLVLEDGDLARLLRGDPLWLTMNVPAMPVFSVGFVQNLLPTGLCQACKKPLTGSVEAPFHEFPGDLPACSTPVVEWAETNPPPPIQEALGAALADLVPAPRDIHEDPPL